MIKVKHLLDPIESDDGERIWIEPIGLTRDLSEMCAIDAVMSHLAARGETPIFVTRHKRGLNAVAILN
jgi:hypothetical protein